MTYEDYKKQYQDKIAHSRPGDLVIKPYIWITCKWSTDIGLDIGSTKWLQEYNKLEDPKLKDCITIGSVELMAEYSVAEADMDENEDEIGETPVTASDLYYAALVAEILHVQADGRLVRIVTRIANKHYLDEEESLMKFASAYGHLIGDAEAVTTYLDVTKYNVEESCKKVGITVEEYQYGKMLAEKRYQR